ncbi:MAG: response regulator [Syntrophales bacterium]|jgi:tetratricopeptide (TPR) repeat protein
MATTLENISSSQSSPTDDLKKKKVLVVEDFLNFRLTLRSMLKSFNISYIDEAATGEEAIEKISSMKYDIILCDYNLGPGKDGQQVLEEARCCEHIDYSTVFIMVTAENTMEMIMGALEYQPDDYLIKPFTKEALEKKLKNLSRKKVNLKDIEKAVEKKDYTNVIALCDEQINSHTKSLSDLLKLKGETLIKKQAYAEATKFYEKVLTMGNLPWATFGLGKVKFIIGDYNEAKSAFEKIIAKNSKIVAAYDWLAKTHEKMGNNLEAQRVLQDAVRISPKAILRQRTLGTIAHKNKDSITAEQAFKEAVKYGKHSFFKSPSDYTCLANVLVDKGAPIESLGVLSDAGKEFSDNPKASIQISVAESLAFKKLNRVEDAGKAAQKAYKLLPTLPGMLPIDIELDLAKALFLTGNEKSGKEIVRHVVQSNHDNQELISNVQAIFKDLNIEDKGREIISTALNEVIKLNNDGIRLFQEGNLSRAINFFEQAVERLPDNKTINANAAHALMTYMQKHGSQPRLLEKAILYIDRVKSIDPLYKNLEILTNMHKELMPEASHHGG